MKLLSLVTVACAGFASAQNLTQALASQNSSLSVLTGLLSQQPALVAALSQAQNLTILAPNNNALQRLTSNPTTAAALASNPGLIAALLTYHVLNGSRPASSFNGSSFVPTLLVNQTYTNVTGGQRVQAVARNGTVTFFSALKENSTVVTPNINFTGGVIHVVDSVLSLPGGLNSTLISANLTAAAGALARSGQLPTVSRLRDLTVFAPSNAAFAAIGNLTAGWSNQSLAGVLGYHVVNGSVGYSTRLSANQTLRTLTGQNLTLSVVNGSFYVNSARVVTPDLLFANGVIHIIDGVLNPNNTSIRPSGTVNPPAFPNAGTGTAGVPFTSGVPAPTSTAPVATITSAPPVGGSTGTAAPTAASTSSSRAAGVPMQTAAVGAAALFAGAGIFVNL